MASVVCPACARRRDDPAVHEETARLEGSYCYRLCRFCMQVDEPTRLLEQEIECRLRAKKPLNVTMRRYAEVYPARYAEIRRRAGIID